MDCIDLRSDTVTHPTTDMIKAMAHARVGDDVYADDPTVNQLEEVSADLMGKQAALFVPSGTFGNQLCLLTHTRRGNEVIIARSNHIVQHEAGAAAFLSNVQLMLVDDRWGHVQTSQVESLIREEDLHHPDTGLICNENAHSDGTVLSLDEMKDLYRLASRHSIPLHLDGARIFNAAVSLGVKAEEIAAYSDSVMFCLSKGLCCPVGSMVCGSSKFIAKARKYRKLMGGGMRQAGYLAACGLVALRDMAARLSEDHEHAGYLAERLEQIEGIEVEQDRLDINMVFFKVTTEGFRQQEFVDWLAGQGIKINPVMNGFFRLVTHYWISKQDIDLVMDKIRTFFKQ
ncbi:MAG: low-specificity L-threonine aldolase [Actinomycetia bacterium]|nr:low-specificity L-threonine aldolase [Actinomycetes bacterium]